MSIATEAAVRTDTTATQAQLTRRRNDLETRREPTTDFERWLDRQWAWRIQLARQSTTNKASWAVHFETATARRAGDPDVMQARNVGPAVVTDPELQVEHDAFVIQRRHLKGGGTSKAMIGVAVVFGQTLFVYILNTASESNLDAEHEDERGNAFTETLRVAVRRCSYRLWEQDLDLTLELFIPHESRIARNTQHAHNLMATLKWADVRLRAGDQAIDNLHKADSEFVVGILLGLSAKELESIVERLAGAKFAILRQGGWYSGTPPFTHRQEVEHRLEGGQAWREVDKHTLEYLSEMAPALQSLVDKVLTCAGDDLAKGPAGAEEDGHCDWAEVARYAGEELGLLTRLPMHVRRGGKPIHLTHDNGAAAVRRLLGDKQLAGWRTGETWSADRIPRAIEKQELPLGPRQEYVVDNGVSKIRSTIDMPLPPLGCDAGNDCPEEGHYRAGRHQSHGWGIPDWKWQRVEALRQASADKPGGPTAGGPIKRRPLVGISGKGWQSSPGEQRRLTGYGTHNYQVQRRDAAPGLDRAWKPKDTDVRTLFTIDGQDLNRQVGADLEQLLRELNRDVLPLCRPPEPPGQPVDDRSRDDEVAGALAEQRRVEELVRLAEEEVDEAKAAEAPDPLETAEEVLDDRKVDLAEAEREVRRAQRALARSARTTANTASPATSASHGQIDASVPATVAVALQNTSGPEERGLHDAVLTMIDTTATQATLIDHGTRVAVDLRWTFRDVRSQELLHIDRTVHTKRARQYLKEVRVAEIGKFYFGQLHTMADLADRFQIKADLAAKHSRGYQLLHTFLRCHVPYEPFRTALIDCPIDEPKLIIYAHITGDRTPLQERSLNAEYIDWIIQTYTATEPRSCAAWGWHWCGSTHAHDRQLIAEIARRDLWRTGISIADAQTLLQTSRRKAMRPASDPAPSQKRRRTQSLAMPATLERVQGWQNKYLSDHEKTMRPVVCPHSDCRGKNGSRTACATHPVWVPETIAPIDAKRHEPVLCPDCRRTPWSATIIYPDSYLHPWRGRTGPDSKANGARNADGSHLDPCPPYSSPPSP